MLEVRNLTCGYDEGFKLRNINLAVPDGTITGIIGPNGSGKTTLLKAMTGVLKAGEGGVYLEGRDIRFMKPRGIAKRAAVVSQSVEPVFMTVEDFVLLGRMPHFGRFQFTESAEDRRKAAEAIELTDSGRIRDHLMEHISGGERQLVYLARAIAQDARLLLLDEPTAHLDITHQVGVLDLIKKLNREFGLTVVMVLHDLNLAAEYCHSLALMNDGRLHAVGTPEEVIDYHTIEEVYKTVVVVEKNPISRKPYVLIVSEEHRRGTGDG
ncbi:MAG: ABC transporter ATP-binding protein [Kiritimatiellia bacterium]